MVSLTIDGKTVSVPSGTTILEAARQVGITIPTLCWLEKVSPTGACRICVVEVEGVGRPQTACNTPVKEGIVVKTESEQLARIRRQVVQLMLVNHPLDCPVCDAAGECDLQNVCYDLDVEKQSFVANDVNHGAINSWPLIQQVPSRCILCEKCVKVCHEVVGASAITVRENGDRAFIDTVDGKPLNCEFCGNCVAVCPTGTLISKPFKFKARPWEMTRIGSVCTLCGSHCQIDYNVKHDQVYRVTSDDAATVNNGNLCIGGSFGYGYIHSSRRLTTPSVRNGGMSSRTVGWDEALETVVAKIREVGGSSVAGLASPRLTNEENYLFQKLFRAVIGSNNIDSEARFGALRSIRTLDKTIGLKGASNRIDRISRSETVLVFGCDPTAEAPMIDWAIEEGCRKQNGKLVLANMRRVKLTKFANSFLQYRPGSEIWLANALTKIIVDQGLADQSFLQRFLANREAMDSHLAKIDLKRAAQETGLSLEALEAAAALIGKADSVSIVFGGDIVRSDDVEGKTAAIANLALVSGALHGDIGGLFPVDEKGNMQGLLDMGISPETLPGFQDYQGSRTKFEKAWGVQLPIGGRNALQILEGIEKGEIKVLYLAAANPLGFPDSGRWRKALEKVELLVVQDILASDLTALAHVVLPGTSPAEKSGSVTSLDGRVSCLGQSVSPRGQAREDWDILADLYRRLQPKLAYFNTDAVLAEIKDVTGLYGEVCLSGSGRCKPCLKEPYRPAEKGLSYSPVDGGPASGGMQLLTGKILFHFGTTTTSSEGCLEVAPTGFIEMHPDDAAACGVAEGGVVRLTSPVGTTQGQVMVTSKVQRGLLFSPYHFRDVNPQQLIPAGNRVAVQVTKG